MAPTPARGLHHVRNALGLKLVGVERFVLGLDRANDETGHGITTLKLDGRILVIQPGPNEDYIEIVAGPFDGAELDSEYWTKVDLSDDPIWCTLLGHPLEFVDCYSDGFEDVALIFRLRGNRNFSIVLCDTDLVIAKELEPFYMEGHQSHPVFRERIV